MHSLSCNVYVTGTKTTKTTRFPNQNENKGKLNSKSRLYILKKKHDTGETKIQQCFIAKNKF